MTSVSRLGVLALAWVAALGAACAGQRDPDGTSGPPALGLPVVREGVVYTPASIGPHGCVLYSVRIPGGRAPAAMVYRSVEGRFAYGRPERCVRKAAAR